MNPHAWPADAAGHVLTFTHPPERDYRRTAGCTGCSWTSPAPGTGYMASRVRHTKAHAHLLPEATP